MLLLLDVSLRDSWVLETEFDRAEDFDGLPVVLFGGNRNLRGESFFTGDVVRLGDELRLGNARLTLLFLGVGDGILGLLVRLSPAAVPSVLELEDSNRLKELDL
jgi:hypothetical protein